MNFQYFFFVFIFMLLAFQVHAQKKVFIRIYDFETKKIAHGRNYIITDSTIEFKNRHQIIHYSTINYIKIKHSFGHNILAGSILGFSSLGLVALIPYYSQYSFFNKTTTSALVAIFIGLPAGAIIGTMTNIFKKPKKTAINGNVENWKTFKTFVETGVGL